jgi:hypothetical protein
VSQTVAERTAEHITESAHQAAEEFLNDTTQRLQRHVVLTVAMTFAVGGTSGAIIGWMMKRK